MVRTRNIVEPQGVLYGPLTRFETLKRDLQLRNDLPHLSNVFAESPSTKSVISTYDLNQDGSVSSGSHLVLQYTDEQPSLNLSELLFSDYGQACTRMVVIEDISSSLVKHLINLLDISPEVFEEHLLDCGWKVDKNVIAVY